MTSVAQLVTAADSEIAQRQAAGELKRAGLRSGDRVALLANSSPAFIAVVLGALRTGIIPVLLHANLLVKEQESLLANSEPAKVLRGEEVEAMVGGELEVELAPWPLARPMLYTSGTTGTPKGVYSGLLNESDAANLLAEEREMWGFVASDIHLVASPLYHSAPMRFTAGTLIAGGSVLLPGRFDAPTFAAAIEQYQPTSAFVVPAHLQRLAALAELPSLGGFRLIAHAGAPCPQALKRRWLSLLPDGALWEFYGSTEGQVTACSPHDWLERPGTVGRARQGRVVSTDVDGMIWCGVPEYARFEYWRDAERTSAAWRDSAFTVGDIGRLDTEQFLYLDGRRDDLVISGGVNVYPLEVERVLLEHPSVSDAAVFGVDDEQWGQRVCAVVVGDIDAESLMAWMREQVAPYKRPKEILVMEEIPVNSMGKVRRSDLASHINA